MASQNDAEIQRIAQLFQTDPQLQAIMAEYARAPSPFNFRPDAPLVRLDARMKELGINIPDGWQVDPKTGALSQDSKIIRFMDQVVKYGVPVVAAVATLGIANAAKNAYQNRDGATPPASQPELNPDGTLPSTPISGGMPTPPGSNLPPGGIPSGGTQLPDVSDPSFLQRLGTLLSEDPGSLLEQIGNMVGGATQAAGQNRINQEGLDILGRNVYENQLMARADLEGTQRDTAKDDLYRASWYQNRQSGPFNPRPPQPISPSYQEGLTALEQEALERLKKKGEYDTDTMTELQRYTPSQPGAMEQVGTWATPLLRGAGMLLRRD